MELDRHWWKECVFYQIYPRSFQDSNGDGIGDLRGIIDRVDYLADLGVGGIWLGPVFESPGDDMGYDISDYRRILDIFGTMEDWEELRDKLHSRGIRILVDLVVNHTSDEHPWFVSARSSRDDPKHDYYIWREGREGKEPNNWASFFTPSAWEYNPQTDEYYLHLFSKKQPDLNWHNEAVRKEVYEMMSWWLDKGADGFRMDVINLLCKTDGLPDASGPTDMNGYVFPVEHMCDVPPIHEYLQEMAEQVYADKDIFTVGECIALNTEEGKKYTAGKKRELDAVFSFEHIDMDGQPLGKWYYRPWELPELKERLTRWQSELHDGWLGLFWSNQDQPRALSRFGTTGKYRERCAKMLAMVLHTLRGTPFVYQGEELGMVNVPWTDVSQLRDIESRTFAENCRRSGAGEEFMWDAIHRKARDNARTPMPWDGSPNGGFTSGTPWIMLNPDNDEINVEKALADPDSVLHFYRRIIAMRKENLIMPYGEVELVWPEDKQVFAYFKRLEGETWLIAANFSENEVVRSFPEGAAAPELILTNAEDCEWQSEGRLKLAPYQAVILRLS